MPDKTEQMKAWVENWKRVGPILEQLEAEELRKDDNRNAIQEILEMCDWSSEREKPSSTSGLLEQQKWFTQSQNIVKQGKKG